MTKSTDGKPSEEHPLWPWVVLVAVVAGLVIVLVNILMTA